MRLKPSDPDIYTLYGRIKRGDINLQPDFQRGEVWSDLKKQRLIDSILRDWHVPPIHIIVIGKSGAQEVLDGQQRLVSIRDFLEDKIRIDGFIEPYDEEIVALNGFRYSDLPDPRRRKFEQFTIPVYLLTDYSPEEPGELFYRLNQPVSLTAAEQRNAFFGPAREQVKELVLLLKNQGVEKDFIGFTNSRMAYDDVIARLCYALEIATLREKVTATMLASKYRSNQPFSRDIFERVGDAISKFGCSKEYIEFRIKLNRATLFSWLWFIIDTQNHSQIQLTPEILGSFITFFEVTRVERKGSNITTKEIPIASFMLPSPFIDQLIQIYDDRSTSRVTDAISVISRDLIIWIFFAMHLTIENNLNTSDNRLNLLISLFENQFRTKSKISAFSFIDELITKHGWGSII